MPNRNQSRNSRIRHLIRKFVRANQHNDYLLKETVCKSTRQDVYFHLEQEHPRLYVGFNPRDIPDYVEKGIVLSDSRGRGALSR